MKNFIGVKRRAWCVTHQIKLCFTILLFYLPTYYLILLNLCSTQNNIMNGVSALCYDKLKFPMTIQVSQDMQTSQFLAITGDSDYIYAGGFTKSLGFNNVGGQTAQQPVIVKVEQSSRSFIWRRFYVDSTASMQKVTALAIGKSTAQHLAVVAVDSTQSETFIFVVDQLSGQLVQDPAKITHTGSGGTAFYTRSAGLGLGWNGRAIIAFENKETSKPDGYQSRLRIAAYNVWTGTVDWITEQQDYYGQAGAVAFDNSDNIYLGGSNDDSYFDTGVKKWYISFSKIDSSTGTLLSQKYLKPTVQSGSQTFATDELASPYVDHMHYQSSWSNRRLFGTTRSHEQVPNTGSFIGLFTTKVANDGDLPSSEIYFKKLDSTVLLTAYVAGIYPKLDINWQNSQFNYYMSGIIKTNNYGGVYYFKANFQDSNSITLYRLHPTPTVMSSRIEAFFVKNSSKEPIGQSSESGYLAFFTEKERTFNYAPSSTLHDFTLNSAQIISTRDNGSTDCRMITLDALSVNLEWQTSELTDPSATKAFTSIINLGATVDTSITISAEYPIYQYAYDMSFCNAGNPTINTLVPGLPPASLLCYEDKGSASVTFNPAGILDPSGCSDTPWEYKFDLDMASVDSPLPVSPILSIDRGTNTLQVRQRRGSSPENLPQASYLINVTAVEPTGKEVVAFQFTLKTQCCYAPITVSTSSNPSAFTYTIGSPQESHTTGEFSLSINRACCTLSTYETSISPSPPNASLFTIDPANPRHLSWQTADVSLDGTVYTVTVTGMAGDSQCATPPSASISYTVTLERPNVCDLATFSLVASNVLVDNPTDPLLTQYVNYAPVSLVWNQSDVSTSATATDGCGDLTFELWDVTSGSDVDPTIQGTISGVFSGAVHSVSAQTIDFAQARLYQMTFKVYNLNFPSNFQAFPFNILVQDYCEPTSVTVPPTIPTSTLSYTVARPQEDFNFDSFLVQPDPCNLSYTLSSVSPPLVDPNQIKVHTDTVNDMRSVRVVQNQIFFGGDHNSGTYTPGTYTATIKAMADNNFDPNASFTVTINIVDPCEMPQGTLTFIPPISDVTYMVNDPTLDLVFDVNSVTQAEVTASCPPVLVFDVTDASNQALSSSPSYNMFTFDASTSTLSISTTDVNDASTTTLLVLVRYESSVHSYAVGGADSFLVTIGNPCASPTSVTAPAVSQIDPPTYYFKNVQAASPDSASFTMNPFVVNPSFCPVTYACVSNTGLRTDLCTIHQPPYTVSQFNSATGDYTLTSSHFDILQIGNPPGLQAGIYVFTISGTVGDKSASDTFTLTIGDPCANFAQLEIQEHLFDASMSQGSMNQVSTDYILRGPQQDYAWNIQNIASEVGITSYFCGPLEVKLFLNDINKSALDSTLFVDNRSNQPTNLFSIAQTSLLSHVGSYEITYSVNYFFYPSIEVMPTATLLVTVKNPCMPPILTLTPPVSLQDQVYYITDTPLNYQIDPWITNETWCEVSYSFSITNPAVSLPVISFDSDPAQRIFTFSYSSDFLPSGLTQTSYTVTVVGGINTLIQTKSFSLTVKNPCANSLLNSLQVPASQTKLTYMVGSPAQEYQLSSYGAQIMPFLSLCGDVEYTLTYTAFIDNAQTSFTGIISTNSNIIWSDLSNVGSESLTIQTSDLNFVGNHQIEVNANLVTYPQLVLSSPILLQCEIKICETTQVTAPTLVDVAIKFGNEPEKVQYSEFVSDASSLCGFIWTDYQLLQSDGSQISENYAVHDPSSHQIIFDAKENPLEPKLEFNLVLKAKYSDGQTEGTSIPFKLTVIQAQSITLQAVNNTKPFYDGEVPIIFKVIRSEDQSDNKIEVINLGKIVDLEGDQVTAKFTCQKGCDPEMPIESMFDSDKNQIRIQKELAPGNYTLNIILTDQNPIQSLKNEYTLNLEIVLVKPTTQTFAVPVDQKQKGQFDVNPSGILSPIFTIKNINLMGEMIITFNQNMRLITNLTDIDEQVLDLQIRRSQNYDESKDLDQELIQNQFGFNWTCTSFTKSGMIIQIVFANPVFISQSDFADTMIVKVNDGSYFQSEHSNLFIERDFTTKDKIPPQMYNNLATKILEGGIQAAQGGTSSVLSVNLVSNVLFSGALNLFWGLINCLQIIAHFPLINIRMPANCFSMYRVIIKIATFELIQVGDQVNQIEESLGIQIENDTYLAENFDDMGFEQTDPIQNLQIMFFAILALFALPVILRTFWLLFIWSSTVKKLVTHLEGLIYWNLYLRVMFEVFLECGIASMIRMKTLSFKTISASFHSYFAIGMLATLLLFLLSISLFLATNKIDIRSSKFQKRYGELTSNLSHRYKDAQLSPIFFLLRRLIFSSIVVYLIEYNYFQIQLIVFKTSIIVIFVGYVQPYALPHVNKIDLFNETLTLLSTYALFLFTDFVPNPEIRYLNGWGLIFFTLAIVVTNLSVLVIQTIKDVKFKSKVKYQKYRYLKKLDQIAKENVRRNSVLKLVNQTLEQDRIRNVRFADFLKLEEINTTKLLQNRKQREKDQTDSNENELGQQSIHTETKLVSKNRQLNNESKHQKEFLSAKQLFEQDYMMPSSDEEYEMTQAGQQLFRADVPKFIPIELDNRQNNLMEEQMSMYKLTPKVQDFQDRHQITQKYVSSIYSGPILKKQKKSMPIARQTFDQDQQETVQEVSEQSLEREVSRLNQSLRGDNTIMQTTHSQPDFSLFTSNEKSLDHQRTLFSQETNIIGGKREQRMQAFIMQEKVLEDVKNVTRYP